MIKDFNHEEKKALVAILKFVVNADGKITEAEVEKLNEVAEEKGFEDFSEIFYEVDREVHSIADIKELIKKVRSDTHEYDIVKLAVEMAMIDADLHVEELEVLKIMGKEWNIDLSSI